MYEVEDDGGNEGDATAYRWEMDLQRSWEEVREDEHGRLVAVVGDVVTQSERARSKRSREDRVTESIRRGLIRYLVVAVDASSSAAEKDFRPSRLQAAKQGLTKFISDFYDQNPISQLAFSVTRDRIAEKISDLSGTKKCHLKPIEELSRCEGLASLQNTIETALHILRFVPEYGQKELLVLYSSLSTCDPGDIFKTIAEAKKAKLRVSVICLSAELYICKRLAEETGGDFGVAVDVRHLTVLLGKHTAPPPYLTSQSHTVTDLIYMGFPIRVRDLTPAYSFEGRDVRLSSTAYVCPRCSTRATDVPAQCGVCGLQLNSSSHIARSYHHLFPVHNFTEVTEPNVLMFDRCFSCSEIFNSLSSLRLQCPSCQEVFCAECDIFVHDSLHNCPGCVSKF